MVSLQLLDTESGAMFIGRFLDETGLAENQGRVARAVVEAVLEMRFPAQLRRIDPLRGWLFVNDVAFFVCCKPSDLEHLHDLVTLAGGRRIVVLVPRGNEEAATRALPNVMPVNLTSTSVQSIESFAGNTLDWASAYDLVHLQSAVNSLVASVGRKLAVQ